MTLLKYLCACRGEGEGVGMEGMCVWIGGWMLNMNTTLCQVVRMGVMDEDKVICYQL